MFEQKRTAYVKQLGNQLKTGGVNVDRAPVATLCQHQSTPPASAPSVTRTSMTSTTVTVSL